MEITKRLLREKLAVNDAGLANFFKVSRSAVSQWPEDRPLPELRQLQAARERPDLFEVQGSHQ